MASSFYILDSIEKESCGARTLCDVLNFVLKFDGAKMMQPHVQNDFSFYRRTLGKMGRDAQEAAEASMVSMFIANNAPLMAALVKGTTAASGHNMRVKEVIAAIANICCNMVVSDKYVFLLSSYSHSFVSL
jgi:hypothetical protein